MEDGHAANDGRHGLARCNVSKNVGVFSLHLCCVWGGVPPFSKWLVTMVIVSSLRIGLWDPFQMACLWLINGGDPNHLLTWDDPPSISYKVGRLSRSL